ncbi:uncharacterized protein NPIL_690361 [Nephila pilipes]|uniref:Uncharacterized protein n=1 Tax=Nephila pilipes TaxID=299642 RepID=A0A8X6N3S9_NEPPI|nr:uncharacterized protein NPIL_690361 [Nephila pilipes]
MDKVVFYLTLFCALFYNYADAQDECKEQFDKFKKTWREVTEDGNAPDCYNQNGLERFKSTGDEENDKRKYKEFKEHMKGLSTEDQKNMKDCLKNIGKMVMEKLGEEISKECMEEMKKLGEKWKKEAES